MVCIILPVIQTQGVAGCISRCCGTVVTVLQRVVPLLRAALLRAIHCTKIPIIPSRKYVLAPSSYQDNDTTTSPARATTTPPVLAVGIQRTFARRHTAR